MNIEIIRAAVNVKPEELDMDDWAQETACGTVGCIAGNCVIQYYRKININISLSEIQSLIYGYREEAQELMNLTRAETLRLFFPLHWPEDFSWRDAVIKGDKVLEPGTPEYLERVKERVELFIASNGTI